MMRSARIAFPALVVLLATACSDAPTEPGWPPVGEDGGRWATWVVDGVSTLRPPPPPSTVSEQTAGELEEIVLLQRAAGEHQADVERWGGLPTIQWTHQAIDLLEFYWAVLPDVRVASPARSARTMALLHIAMYDAMVAAWDAKYAYERPPPYAVDDRIRAYGPRSRVPSYPSEHAAAAAAAAAVLAYTFPQEDSARFAELAHRAGESRIAAGMAYRSDVEAGLELGRAVAERVLAHARADGSDRQWDGTFPEGPHVWRPTPQRRVRSPYDPMAGTWRTWVLQDGGEFRPAPPPVPGSAVFERDLDEVRRMEAERTLDQTNAALYWATDAPSAWWELFAEQEIRQRKLTPLHAARAQALVSIAIYDAFVAGWDAKYHYWLLRPISADTTVRTLFSTPPFPSYPSGHSTISTAAAEVFTYLFPDAAEDYHAKAREASHSRVWGGVHYRFDILAGEELGEKVGRAVVARAKRDGSNE